MEETIQQKAEKLLKALDNALTDGSWDETNFILIIGKKLRLMRDTLAAQLKEVEDDSSSMSAFLSRKMAMQSTLKEVFVSLYSIDGTYLQSWERILANLRRQMVSRPVYANEADIKAIIKTKEKKINEAYVSIYVDPDDILDLGPDKIPMDKLGKPMLVLKDNAINLDNIDYFMHITGKYRYLRGRLIKLDDNHVS